MTPRLYPSYPIEFTHLLLRAFQAPIRVPHPNNTQAKRFRNHLYSFRRAVKDALPEDGVPDRLTIIAPMLTFQLEGDIVLISKVKHVGKIQEVLENV